MNGAVIVAFQKVIHKFVALFHHGFTGCVFWPMFRGALQEGRNTEIISGFPECVQGDKPRVKLLFAGIGRVAGAFCRHAWPGGNWVLHIHEGCQASKKLNFLKERT